MIQVSGFYADRRLAIDTYSGGPYVYIADTYVAGLAREPKSGSPPAPSCACFVFGSGYAPITDVVTDGTGNVYWAMRGTGGKLMAQATKAQVASWPLSTSNNTCPNTPLVTGVNVAGIGVDASYVYYSDYDANKIKRIPIGGGAVTDLTANCTLPGQVSGEYDSPHHLVVDDMRIYWVYGTGNIWAINKDGSTTCSGTLKPIAQAPGAIWDVAFDTQFLYFGVYGTAEVRRVSK
jgi:hypothetical protein